jgi:protein required for attachment to host cells
VSTTWIVVADRTRCSIYRRQHGLALDPVEHFAHPKGRLTNSEIDTDGQGRGGDSVHGPHTFSPRETAHEHEATVFAKEIARHIGSGRESQRFESLVLVAEPHFLGLLRDALDTPTRALVRNEIQKHLTDAPLTDLAKQVPALLT